jgi:hypothetical protein
MSNSKILLLLTFLFVKVSVSNAQVNLVPNNSFENYSQCPDNSGQIGYALPWTGPVINSTDYYNACSQLFTVPGNSSLHYQYARTGNAYAGIYTTTATNSREYLQVGLTSQLISGKCYYVELFANLANPSEAATNNISVHFSTNPITTTGTGNTLNLTSDIQNSGNPVINDTLNWMKISGVYLAQGDENYITIGNFGDNANTHIDTLNQNGYFSAYYYIDDVSVTEITPSFTPTWSYRDTTINEGDSVYIGSRTGGLKCTWYQNGNVIADSVPGLYVKPNITTSYVVKEILPCSTTSWDTLTVAVNGGVGIRNTNLLEYDIYPNPSSGIFNVYIPNVTVDMEVYNILGVLVRKVTAVSGAITIDLVNQPKGMYFVKITKPYSNESVIKKLSIKE